MIAATRGDTSGTPTESVKPSFGNAAQIPSEIAKPTRPPTAVTRSVSRRNWTRMKRCFAPSAILIPISFVRSSTTTFMMFETPMPPTTSVREPTMPRKPVNASMNVSKNLNCPVVSHTESASLSFGSNFLRLPRISRMRAVSGSVSNADLAW